MTEKKKRGITISFRFLFVFFLAYLLGFYSGWTVHDLKVKMYDPYKKGAGKLHLRDFVQKIPPAGKMWENNSAKLAQEVKCKFGDIVQEIAELHNFTSPDLALAVIAVESKGKPMAKSRSGAEGLMQLMPKTAKSLGVANTYNPRQNIIGGIKYLQELEKGHKLSSVSTMLVAYNRGPDGAKEFLKNGGDPKKDKYVRRVASVLRALTLAQ